MSFADNPTHDIEDGLQAHNQYSDFPEFDQLSRAIENRLHAVQTSYLAPIRRILQSHDHLDPTDPQHAQKTRETVESLKGHVAECVDAFRAVNRDTADLNQYLRQYEREHADQDTVLYMQQKEMILIGSIKNVLHLFQRQQRRFAALEKSLAAPQSPSQAPGLETERAQSQQEQKASQIQITYEPINAEELERQLLLVQERERHIHRIAQDTQEINDIYQDLLGIIQEQLFQIDNIEDNIMTYHGHVQGAAGELRRAERYQRRSRGRMLCCFLILLGVFGSVVFIMVVF